MRSSAILPLVLSLLSPATAVYGADQQDGGQDLTEQAPGKGTLVTTAPAERRDVEVWLDSMGKLKSRTAPTLAAEVDGRVVAIHVDMGDSVEQGQSLLELDATPLRLERDAASADIHRFDAQIDNEERRVERLKKLSTKKYVARTQLDDAEAQLAVYRAEREAAQARLAIAEDKIERARVPAHVGGEVERRYISEGDFVKRGDPLFDITEPKSLQAWLPLPETVAGRLVRGQQVLLWSPLARDVRVEAKLDDLRPSVGAGSRAVTAIVDVTNPGPWRPEATVVARILVERRENAVLVPTLALVRRPAGDVVYLIGNGQARARIVRTGQRLDGMVEILEGIEGDETVAVEGAAWLTDGAAVRVAEAQQ